MSKTSPFIELAALRNHLHTPVYARNLITRYIKTSAFLYMSLNFNKDHGKIIVVKVAILFYLYLVFLFYILTSYMGDLSRLTFEALSPRGSRSVEVHIYIYIYI